MSYKVDLSLLKDCMLVAYFLNAYLSSKISILMIILHCHMDTIELPSFPGGWDFDISNTQ